MSNPLFRKLVGKMFLATRVAFLDSPTIAEIVYVIFNLVARLMLDIGVRSEFSRGGGGGGGGGKTKPGGRCGRGMCPLPREARKLSVLFSFISIDHAVISMNINYFGYARGGGGWQMPPPCPNERTPMC